MKSKLAALVALFLTFQAFGEPGRYQCHLDFDGKSITFEDPGDEAPIKIEGYQIVFGLCGPATLTELATGVTISAYDLTDNPPSIVMELNANKRSAFLGCVHQR